MLYSNNGCNNSMINNPKNNSTITMDDNDRIKIQRYYQKLIEVSYSSISPHLISHFILDLEMHADIESLPTDKKKIEKLLALLPSRGNRAMVEFINALRPNYNWIAEKLGDNPTATNVLNDFNSNSNQTIHNCNIMGSSGPNQITNDGLPSTSTFSYGNSENLRDLSITKYTQPVERILRRSPSICRNWCLLANTMGIDPCTQTDIRRQMNYEGGTAYAINSTLEAWVSKCGPSKATFAHLTSITESEEINDVTEALIDLWKTLQ